ncbi:MAG: hypothetical protein CVU15_10910 [Betaproteobacteria bacterium HGW-Betaproteobacteria-1]|jgi:hypothetical protein|nr:MAG: hypothetical protein CVU15_10910 [Betaproteobacteria bacterium HGW-Betaproteobacteria-1]
MKAYSTINHGPSVNADFRHTLEPSVRNLDDKRAILWLDTQGNINDCNLTAVKMLGCRVTATPPLHVTALLPQLKEMKLIDGCHLNSHLRYVAHLGHRFEVFSLRGTRFEGELFFSDIEQPAPHAFRLIISLHNPVQRVFSVK